MTWINYKVICSKIETCWNMIEICVLFCFYHCVHVVQKEEEKVIEFWYKIYVLKNVYIIVYTLQTVFQK